MSDLKKLENSKALLGGRCNVASTRLLIFSRSGSPRDLEAEAARRSDLELVDLARLYSGA